MLQSISVCFRLLVHQGPQPFSLAKCKVRCIIKIPHYSMYHKYKSIAFFISANQHLCFLDIIKLMPRTWLYNKKPSLLNDMKISLITPKLVVMCQYKSKIIMLSLLGHKNLCHTSFSSHHDLCLV